MDKIIFAANYDGTYRHIGDRPTEDDLERVRKFREKGNHFGIITDRDVFQVMAIIGMFYGQFDFIVCCSGACTIVRSKGKSNGTGLESVGVEGDPLVQLYCGQNHQSLLVMLYDLFTGVGMTSMQADVPGFRGGPDMAWSFNSRFDSASEIGCGLHFWYHGGQFFQGKVGREALAYVFPFTQCSVSFKNSYVTDGACDAVHRLFPGQFAIHRNSDTGITLTAPGTDREYGIRRYAELAGISQGRIYTAGNAATDAGMLKAFNGIAVSGSSPEAIAAAKYEVLNFSEAISLAEEKAGI